MTHTDTEDKRPCSVRYVLWRTGYTLNVYDERDLSVTSRTIIT